MALSDTQKTKVVRLEQLATFKTVQDEKNAAKFASVTDVNALKKKALSAANVKGTGVATATFAEGDSGATLTINVPAPTQYTLPDATAKTKGGVYAVIGTAADNLGTVKSVSGTGLVVESLQNVPKSALATDVQTTLGQVANKAESSTVTALNTTVTNHISAYNTKMASVDSAISSKMDTTTANNTFATKAQVASAVIPKGSSAVADLPTPSASNLGWMYNITAKTTTTADFVEGAGKTIEAGTNIVCVNTATTGAAVYKWDAFAGMVDTSSFALKSEIKAQTTVSAGSGIAVSGGSGSYTVGIKASGVTNDMLAGSIAAEKLAGSIPSSKLDTAVQSTLTQVDTNKTDIAGLKTTVAGKQDSLTFATNDDIDSIFS